MKKSRFTDGQILYAVKGLKPALQFLIFAGSWASVQLPFYKWRSKYGGMDVSLMSRMKELEEENRRLKKMYLEEKIKAEIVSEALEKKF